MKKLTAPKPMKPTMPKSSTVKKPKSPKMPKRGKC